MVEFAAWPLGKLAELGTESYSTIAGRGLPKKSFNKDTAQNPLRDKAGNKNALK